MLNILFCLQSSGSPPSAFEVPYNSFREQLDSGVADAADVKNSADKLQQSNKKDLEYDFLCYFLSTNRLDLYRSIDFRCEDMLLGKKLMKSCDLFACFNNSLEILEVSITILILELI